jgi:phosphoribosyl-dephospho-CoA transferase
MAELELDVPATARPPLGLHRQQLVRLSLDGWAHVLQAPWDADARACLTLWAERGLPLVVTRQPLSSDDALATGLPAPSRFRRRRLAVAVAPRDLLFLDEFPGADAAARLLPRALAPAWRALVAALAAHDCAARVYGGYGWQALTRLAYVHAASDLDLLLPVSSAAQADAVARTLASVAWDGPRLDGELLFPDGAAVAWREWLDHRERRVALVLVKRLRGVALENLAARLA